MSKKETYHVPKGYFYTKDHEWVLARKEAAVVLVGITDYAAKMLHDIVYVTLPEEGAKFQRMDVLGQVESVKTVADIFMPVSGVITKTNQKLTVQPELVSNSPYEEAWMVEVSASNFEAESHELLDSSSYASFIEKLQAEEA